MEKRKCEKCEKEYEPVTAWQRFCSDKCRQKAFQDERREEEKREKEAQQTQTPRK
jgi:hypothetical protein